jgi:hypothetical protein
MKEKTRLFRFVRGQRFSDDAIRFFPITLGVDSYLLNVRQNNFNKDSRAKTPRRKVMGQAPSSRTNVRYLREISPFGRNDNVPPWRALRLCASHLFADSGIQFLD